MNTELIKHYMGKQQKAIDENAIAVTENNVLQSMSMLFKNDWTWELTDERIIDKTGCIMTTVTVYIPGRILTGRSLCNMNDYGNNHLKAIYNAVSVCVIEDTKTVTQNPQSAPAPQQTVPQEASKPATTQMSSDEIMAVVHSMQSINPATEQPSPATEKVDTAEQFYNYKDANGETGNGVPFENITENCIKELQSELTGESQVQQPNPNIAPKKYTKEQIDRVNNFKKEFDILNDEMFGKWVNSWNKNFTSKHDLTPDNVDEFLYWVEHLGE